MGRLFRAILLTACVALTAAQTWAQAMGSAASPNYVLGETFDFRVSGGQFSFDIGRESDEIYTDTGSNFGSVGAMADWHPFTTGFYVSGGLVLSVGEGEAAAASRAPAAVSGAPSFGRSRGFSDIRSFAPYLGLGYSTQLTSSLDLSLSVGAVYGRDGSLGPGANFDLDKRRTEDSSDLQFYPLAGFTARYRF